MQKNSNNKLNCLNGGRVKAISILFGYCLKALVFGCVFAACSDDDGPDELPTGILQLTSVKVGIIALELSDTKQDIPIDKGIVISFNLPLATDLVSQSILLEDISGASIDLDLSYLDDNKTISATPISSLTNHTEYTLQLGELTATTGEVFSGVTYRFITIEGALVLLSATINDESLFTDGRLQNMSPDVQISATFSEALAPSTKFDEIISLSFSDLTFSLSDDQKTLTIETAETLEYGEPYLFRISSNLTSEQGLIFEGFSKDIFTALDPSLKFPEITDEALLTKVQEQTFTYFWDFGHPVSGLIRERNSSGDIVTIGGSGFGVMAIIVAIERGFISREDGIARLDKIVGFLKDADRFHGVWPHWLNGSTGETIPFGSDDDGGDLVETALMIQGLLTARQYLNDADPAEASIKASITQLWEEVEWDWYTQDDQNVLYWHWSENIGWQKNLKIQGWNESLIVYVLAASSPTHPISTAVYHEGWARNGELRNGSDYYDITLPMGEAFGGPLFFSQYSFLGLDPRNLEDQYANYWNQNVNHSLINRAYCIDNPIDYIGFSSDCWGLTASDNHEGYSAHSPNNDLGVITPTAALSAFPYTPVESMDALHHFYYILGDKLWGEYGFYDAFNLTEAWYANSTLAIDQGPIILMIENHRTGLLWDLFMNDTEITSGLDRLSFTSY